MQVNGKTNNWWGSDSSSDDSNTPQVNAHQTEQLEMQSCCDRIKAIMCCGCNCCIPICTYIKSLFAPTIVKHEEYYGTFNQIVKEARTGVK